MPAFPAIDEAAALGNGVAGTLGVGAALIDHGRRYQRPHAALLDDLGDRIRVVIHVDKRGRAAPNHFPTGQLGANTDELGIHELDFRREYVVRQPVHECQVIRDAAQQRHGGVLVAVDDPGHDDTILTAERFHRVVARVDIGSDTDLEDDAIVDRDGAVLDNAELLVHCDDPVALHDQINRSGISRSCCRFQTVIGRRTGRQQERCQRDNCGSSHYLPQ